jgi:hypothetical protein
VPLHQERVYGDRGWVHFQTLSKRLEEWTGYVWVSSVALSSATLRFVISAQQDRRTSPAAEPVLYVSVCAVQLLSYLSKLPEASHKTRVVRHSIQLRRRIANRQFTCVRRSWGAVRRRRRRAATKVRILHCEQAVISPLYYRTFPVTRPPHGSSDYHRQVLSFSCSYRKRYLVLAWSVLQFRIHEIQGSSLGHSFCYTSIHILASE